MVHMQKVYKSFCTFVPKITTQWYRNHRIFILLLQLFKKCAECHYSQSLPSGKGQEKPSGMKQSHPLISTWERGGGWHRLYPRQQQHLVCVCVLIWAECVFKAQWDDLPSYPKERVEKWRGGGLSLLLGTPRFCRKGWEIPFCLFLSFSGFAVQMPHHPIYLPLLLLWLQLKLHFPHNNRKLIVILLSQF